jgi:hypothetical protein
MHIIYNLFAANIAHPPPFANAPAKDKDKIMMQPEL